VNALPPILITADVYTIELGDSMFPRLRADTKIMYLRQQDEEYGKIQETQEYLDRETDGEVRIALI